MIYILGAGGFAREVYSFYRHLGKSGQIAAFVEENCKDTSRLIYGNRVMDASVIDTLSKNDIFIGAIGSPARSRWVEEVEARDFDFDMLIHPTVITGENVSVGKGSIICPYVTMTCDVTIGKHVIIDPNTVIGHDSIIGDFATILPGSNIGGRTKIGKGTLIGIGTTIVDSVSIGEGSFIGAGSLVLKDLPDNVLAAGVPAKPLRKIKESDRKYLQGFHLM